MKTLLAAQEEKKRQREYHENRRSVTCNKCGYSYTSGQAGKDLICPSCHSNESFSIR
uniref:Putative metallochaperone n=1 Tax=viral metagenome TaxID=1070528 RepID=A0A6M3LDJ0_9ZZZZ